MRKNILVRYLFSYLLVLLIPTMIFGIFSDRYFIAMYRDEVIEQNRLNLERVKNSFDIQTGQLIAIAGQFMAQSVLTARNISENPTAYIQIIRILQGFDYANSFIDNIAYYHQDAPHVIYTCKGTYNPVYYIEYWRDEYSLKIPFEEVINHIDAPTWICMEKQELSPAGISGPYLEYAMPVPDMPDAYVFFRISTDNVEEIVYGDLHDRIGRTLILDQKLRRLYSYEPVDTALLAEIEKYVSTKKQESAFYIKVRDEYMLYTKSEKTKLIYVRFIPRTTMLEEVINRQNLFRMILICMVLLGSAAVFFLATTNYRPIRRLGMLVESNVRGIPDKMDGIQRAQFAISELKKHSQALEEENQKVLRERLLLRLIRGKYATMEQFNQDCLRAGVYISEKTMRILVLYMDTEDAQSDLHSKEIFFRTTERLSEIYRVYGVEYPEQSSHIFLIAYNQESSALLKLSLQEICRRLSQEYNATFRMAAGSPCYRALDVFDSYRQAVSAGKAGLSSCPERILLYDEMSHSDHIYVYPKEEIDALYRAILSTKTDKIEFIYDLLINIINDYYSNQFITAALCYDVINTYLRAMERLNRSYQEMSERYSGYVQTEGLFNVDSLIEVLYRIHDDTLSYINGIIREGSGMIDKIIRYVNEHFTDPDFCVGTMAQHFELSVSNLSHYFKTQVHCNVSDYINILKIDFAKKLLRTTDLSIQEIAVKIGYIRPSSFIRKFKQHEKTTPGDYRSAFTDQ